MTNFERIKKITIDEMAAFLEKSGFTTALRLLDDYICRDQKLIKEWLEGERQDEIDVDPNDVSNKIRLVTSSGRVYTDWICPCCKTTLQQSVTADKKATVHHFRFCPECGQPLDWNVNISDVIYE